MKSTKDHNHTYEDIQKAELDSWFSSDPNIEADKKQREVVRYPLLKKQMGLDHLDTSKMIVYDIGCGPFGGVSSVLNTDLTVRIDPLMEDYQKHYNTYNGRAMKAEDLKDDLSVADLIIVTNAMDHFENPERFLKDLCAFMKPGAYFAHLHAIDNAYSHPHEAHAQNVNPEMFRELLDKDFELCWYLDYIRDGLTYGWRKQPAFSGLYRKVTGYHK